MSNCQIRRTANSTIRQFNNSTILIILLLALFTIAATQSRFDQVGHTLMCTCGCNEILLECNHVGCPNSDGMRLRLASMVKDGASTDAIYHDFIAEYGNIVVASPIGGGFNRVAWIMPFAVLFAGLIGVGVVAKRWHHPATTATNPLPVEDDLKLEPFRQQARNETEE
ncbi:MAG: cytochrome c-type biogenesis protein CcmH [Acidobacteriaceae bacterium]